MRSCLSLALVSLVIGTMACTTYTALTPPPPGYTASLNTVSDELTISPGVAIAFECVTAGGNPCSDGQATVADPTIAKVFPAYLSGLKQYYSGTYKPSSYVVVGMKPGRTTLQIPDQDPLQIIVQ